MIIIYTVFFFSTKCQIHQIIHSDKAVFKKPMFYRNEYILSKKKAIEAVLAAVFQSILLKKILFQQQQQKKN